MSIKVVGQKNGSTPNSEAFLDRRSNCRANSVTAVEISEKHKNDSPYFKPLVEATARNFTMREVSIDKAYISNTNLQADADAKAVPYIPVRVSHGASKKTQTAL